MQPAHYIDNIQDPQKLASNPKASVFVSASAGTGKTKILCDRFLNLMLEGASASHIMCITYTKSAAAEMKERIVDLASTWAHMESAELAEMVGSHNIERAKNLYNEILIDKYKLNISTLHSFCLDLLSKYSESFQKRASSILDPTLKSQMFRRILDDMRSAMQGDANIEIKEAFLFLSRLYTTYTIDARIVEALSRLSEFEGYIEQFQDVEMEERLYQVHESTKDFQIEEAVKKFFASTQSLFLLALNELKEIDNKAIEILDVITSCDFDVYKSLILTLEGAVRKALFSSKKAVALVPNIGELLEEERIRIENVYTQIRNYYSANINIAFMRLALAVYHEYEAVKSKRHLLDYDDIVNEAIKLIEDDPEVLYKLDYKIDHILVDEAQDLSEVQWNLIKTLSGDFFSGVSLRAINRTVFIVGDFKQSIFGFQGAKPELFLQIASYYRERVSAINGDWYEVDMNKSYRSELSVLEIVNSVCSPLFEGFHNHVPHKTGFGHVQIWPLVDRKKSEKSEDNLWLMPRATLDEDAASLELANRLASTVISWIGKRCISGTDKLVKASDILILVRKRSVMLDILTSRLKAAGIKVSAPSHGSLASELAVQDCLSIIKFILYPDDDLNLAALLKSPFINISESELFEISHNRGRDRLLDRVEQQMPNLYQALSAMVDIFTRTDLYNAYHQVLYRDGLIKNFVARLGYDCLHVIDAFLDATLSFQALDANKCLESFVQYINAYRSAGSAVSDGALRIMTVHSSKGLQAPIVIFADSSSSEQGSVESVFYEDGQLYFAPANDYSSDRIKSVKQNCKTAGASENKRLLYVAMTRAETELFVTGVENNRARGSWYELIKDAYDPKMSVKEYDLLESEQGEEDGIPSEYQFITLAKQEVESDYFTLKNQSVMRGEIIHRFLEDAQGSGINMDAACIKYAQHFSELEISDFYNEAVSVVNAFPDLFNDDIGAKSEQEVVYVSDGKLKTVRIDKLIITDAEIHIVDFKTDEVPPQSVSEVRSEYIQQLQGYVDIIKTKFSDHVITASLLWTRSNNLMRVI